MAGDDRRNVDIGVTSELTWSNLHYHLEMLVSPALCHDRLQSILGESSTGPHTALIATPNGQLVSSASNPRSEDEADSDEPWLDEPERIRLLLGLLSQWEEDESPRIECEVSLEYQIRADIQLGRLFVRSIPLPPSPEATTSHASMPPVRMPQVHRFVLLVNGTAHTSWSELESKVGAWRDQG